MNANSGAVDALFANVAAIGLTNAPVTLNSPPNSGAAWAGPYQSQSGLIRFTGALSANVTVTFPRAGYFIVENLCTNTGTWYVQLSNGSGNTIGAIPGKKCHVYNDGTNMDYMNLPDPGTAYDLHGATTYPPWMNACTVKPYLIKDGTVYNNSSYPALSAVLGNAFGGTPSVSFAVPDERARMRVPYDTGSTGRMTSPVNATTMGSAGGEQSHTLTNAELPVTNPAAPGFKASGGFGGGVKVSAMPFSVGTAYAAASSGGALTTAVYSQGATLDLSIDPATLSIGGGLSHDNVQPSIVTFLALVKT